MQDRRWNGPGDPFYEIQGSSLWLSMELRTAFGYEFTALRRAL